LRFDSLKSCGRQSDVNLSCLLGQTDVMQVEWNYLL
jgi:hypothetical protein